MSSATPRPPIPPPSRSEGKEIFLVSALSASASTMRMAGGNPRRWDCTGGGGRRRRRRHGRGDTQGCAVAPSTDGPVTLKAWRRADWPARAGPVELAGNQALCPLPRRHLCDPARTGGAALTARQTLLRIALDLREGEMGQGNPRSGGRVTSSVFLIPEGDMESPPVEELI